MIMNSAALTELLLLYLYDKKLLSRDELKKLKEGYAAKMSIDNPVKINSILNTLN